VGGLDVERDWPTILSLGERQQLAIARLILARPAFAMLDRVSTALGSARLTQSLQRLTDNSIAYMNFDEAVVSVDLYDAVLEIDANATWNWTQRAC
jgi:putative ATP-binding cassette transporter